jgi:hypothetical protein
MIHEKNSQKTPDTFPLNHRFAHLAILLFSYKGGASGHPKRQHLHDQSYKNTTENTPTALL